MSIALGGGWIIKVVAIVPSGLLRSVDQRKAIAAQRTQCARPSAPRDRRRCADTSKHEPDNVNGAAHQSASDVCFESLHKGLVVQAPIASFSLRHAEGHGDSHRESGSGLVDGAGALRALLVNRSLATLQEQ